MTRHMFQVRRPLRKQRCIISLRGFHIVFIIAAILLTVFFGVWAYQQYSQNQGLGYFGTAVISFLLAIGLVVYGFKFAQKIKAVVFLICFLNSKLSSACSICFYGDPNDPMNQGLKAGILLLLGVLLVVMILLVSFFINFSKRAKIFYDGSKLAGKI